jgi:amino acid transporter
MVGAGVFSLPARFEVATGILGSLIAWAVAGTGMLMLGFVFQNLAIRKPNLDSGVFIYAKAGFGDYAGQLRRRRHVPGRGSRHRRSVALPLPDREDLPLRRRPG